MQLYFLQLPFDYGRRLLDLLSLADSRPFSCKLFYFLGKRERRYTAHYDNAFKKYFLTYISTFGIMQV